VSVFVRDRGKGFDPDAVPGDRKGVTQSIRARVARHGGSATIRSTPGEGTEVSLSMKSPEGYKLIPPRQESPIPGQTRS
jgi:signal transduction histidine kinase